jgi:glycosyltransferase involved in cell wall biosynthesis
MRVLFVEPACDRRGHYGIYVLSLCQALAEAGHQVLLCTNKAHPDRHLSSKPAFEIHEVEGGRLTFEPFDQKKTKSELYYWYGYFRNSYAVLKGALKLARTRAFDVLHVTGTEYMTLSLLLKKYSGKIPPVVIEIPAANFGFRVFPGSALKRTYKMIQRAVFKRTIGREIRGISVLGEFQKEQLYVQLGLGSGFPILVTGNAASMPSVELEKSEARRRVGLGGFDGTVFLFFGMIRRDKGIEYLFEATARLQGNPFRVLVAGVPFDYSEEQVKTLITAKSLQDRLVSKLAYIAEEDVPAYFYASDVLVLPYPKIYTGGSGPLIRGACSHGKPVIVTDVSEMGRLVKANQFGLVAEPENPASLAEKMAQFLAMPPQERQRMAANAFAVAKQFSWEKMVGQFEELYRRALQ